MIWTKENKIHAGYYKEIQIQKQDKNVQLKKYFSPSRQYDEKRFRKKFCETVWNISFPRTDFEIGAKAKS